MTESWGKGFKISVIDDSLDFSTAFIMHLKQSGFKGEAHYYPSGRAFFAHTSLDEDFIVSDISMPEMSGFQVYHKLMEKGYDGGFMMCSGDMDLLEQSFSLSSEINIMIKPLDFTKVIERFKACLNH